MTILVRKDSTGAYQGFTCMGHAGYAKRGKDIVCAAVSSAAIMSANTVKIQFQGVIYYV